MLFTEEILTSINEDGDEEAEEDEEKEIPEDEEEI